jgi:hypothetical protein
MATFANNLGDQIAMSKKACQIPTLDMPILNAQFMYFPLALRRRSGEQLNHRLNVSAGHALRGDLQM